MKRQLTESLDATPHLRVVSAGPRVCPAPAAVHLEIIVPALNEEQRLGASLQGIVAYLATQPYRSLITVIDNGSVDRTPDLVVEGGVHPVPIRIKGCRHPGKGAAVRRGVLTSQATYVGFSDADLSTPVEALDVIVPELESGHPVVIASRRCPGAEYVISQPWVRRLASRAFHRATRACLPDLDQIHDTQCGFKFFDADVARRLFRHSTTVGFAFDAEILALALMDGHEVVEVPVRWTHVEGSQVSVTRNLLAVGRELHRMRGNLRSVHRSGMADATPLSPRRMRFGAAA